MSARHSFPSGARALAFLMLLVPVAVQAQAQRYTLTGDAAIYDLVGQVRLEPASAGSVVAEVQRLGGDAGKLRVETGKIGSWQTLRVVFPDDEIVYDRMGWHGNTSLTVRSDGTFGDRSFWRDEAGAAYQGDDGHQVKIRGSGSGLHAYADVVVQVPKGGRVALFLGVGRVDARNVNGRLWLSTSAGDASVDHHQGALRVSSGSGDLRLTETTGDAVVATGSGDVTIQGVRGGSVRLSTGSGDVNGGSVSATTLDASTGSGDVKLRDVSVPRAKLSTGSGDVNLGLVSALESLNASSGSGDVTLGLPASTSARLRFSSGSGEIDTDFPVTVTSRRHGSFVGTIGDGRGEIVVSTGSGSVRLDRR